MSTNKVTSAPQYSYLLIVLAALTMFPPMSIDMYLPSFPALADYLHVHIVDMQLSLTSFMAGMGLGQLFYGPISDRFGRKNPAYFGIAVFVVASILCTTATNLPILIALRFLQAFGASAALVCSRAIVRDLLSGVEMAKMMSAMSMIFIYAPAFAPTIGTLILHFASWQGIFLALVVFAVVVTIAFSRIPESLPRELRNDHGLAQAGQAYKEILKNSEFRSSAIVMMGTSVLTFSYVSSSPAVVMGSFHQSHNAFALIFGMISIPLLVSNRVNIALVGKFGLQKMLRGFTIVQTIASLFVFLAAIFHAPLWALLIPIVICFGCSPGMGGNAMTLGMHPFPEKAASAAAMLGFLQFLASATISALLSTMHQHTVINMSVAMVFGALLSFVQVRKLMRKL